MTQTGLFECPLQGEPTLSLPSVCILAIQKASFIPFPRRKCPVPLLLEERSGFIGWVRLGEVAEQVGSPLRQSGLCSACVYAVSMTWSGSRPAFWTWVWKSVCLCPWHGWGGKSKEVHLPYIPKFSPGRLCYGLGKGGLWLQIQSNTTSTEADILIFITVLTVSVSPLVLNSDISGKRCN